MGNELVPDTDALRALLSIEMKTQGSSLPSGA